HQQIGEDNLGQLLVHRRQRLAAVGGVHGTETGRFFDQCPRAMAVHHEIVHDQCGWHDSVLTFFSPRLPSSPPNAGRSRAGEGEEGAMAAGSAASAARSRSISFSTRTAASATPARSLCCKRTSSRRTAS